MFYRHRNIILKGCGYSIRNYFKFNRVVWLKVCSKIGDGFIHSIEVEILYEEIHPREEATPSQIIHMNKITDKNEINLPREETTFHVVKASG
jgi:hypothetical protein